MNKIKIAIPTDSRKGMEDTIADHFGRCNTFTFIDENGNVLEIIDNTTRHMGGSGLPPELIKKHGADVLLCKDIGPRAIEMFQEFDIDVFVCNSNTVKEIFDRWKKQKIKKAGLADACEEHKH